MKFPMNSIITGLKALYLHGMVSFNPEYVELRMPRGKTNVNEYKKEHPNFKIKTRHPFVYKLFTEIKNDHEIYIKERLLVEIDTFKIDNILCKQAITNLLKVCDYKIVDKIINSEVIKMQRMTPSQASIDFVKNMKIDFDAITNVSLEQWMREYLMSRISQSNKKCIIKGGSAIEIYYNSKKRATQDIDQYMKSSGLKPLIDDLKKFKDGVRFNIKNFNKGEFDLGQNIGHDRLKITPISNNPNIQHLIKLENINYTIDIDYSLDDINSIINEYNLKPKKLKIINNRTALILNRSMLFAEKILGLLNSFSDKSKIIRIKDYVDLLVISNNNKINILVAQKWLNRKIKIKNYSHDYSFLYMKFIKKINLEKHVKEINNTISTFNLVDVQFNYQRTLDIIKDVIRS